MISIQDMADLIYLCDAYRHISEALFGKRMALGYKDGPFGRLSKGYDIILRNAAEEFKKNDNRMLWKVAEDTSKTPEERAGVLLKKTYEEKEAAIALLIIVFEKIHEEKLLNNILEGFSIVYNDRIPDWAQWLYDYLCLHDNNKAQIVNKYAKEHGLEIKGTLTRR